jgi:PRTRC genetic system protein F
MMPAATSCALAIPQLSPDVPLKYLINDADDLVAPLAIALLEANVITDAMLRHPKNATLEQIFGGVNARDLAMRGLSKWWDATIKANSCKFFRWQLHVQRLVTDFSGAECENEAWFIFSRMDGEIPRFALENRITQLEATVPGFGQTVLAVLKDATRHLPDSFTPWDSVHMAQYMYWDNSETDEEMLEEMCTMRGYETVQELLGQDGDIMTRERFYSDVPQWVTAPNRAVSRDEIVAANLGHFEQQVVAACDAITQLVNHANFTLTPSDKGSYRCGLDTTDGAMVLLWRQFDVIGQVIDDVVNQLFQGGESTEFIDANPVPMTVEGIRHFQALTEQMMKLAVLTENLILLIGERL